MSEKTSNQDTPRKFLRYARKHLFPLTLLLDKFNNQVQMPV